AITANERKLMKTVSLLEKKIVEKDLMIQKLQTQLAELMSTNMQIESINKKLEDTNKQLEEKVDEQSKKIDSLTAECKSLEENINNLRLAISFRDTPDYSNNYSEKSQRKVHSAITTLQKKVEKSKRAKSAPSSTPKLEPIDTSTHISKSLPSTPILATP